MFDVSKVPGQVAVLVDVGVNRGQFALPAIEYFHPVKYLGVEMLPDLACALQCDQRMHRLPHYQIKCCALGSEHGISKIRRVTWDPSSSLLELNPAVGPLYGFEMEEIDGGYTPVMRLDSLCQEVGIQGIDLLKLDVQGYEMHVLAGASGLLYDGKVWNIIVEMLYCQHYKGQAQPDDIHSLLVSYGFKRKCWLREHPAGLEKDALYVRR